MAVVKDVENVITSCNSANNLLFHGCLLSLCVCSPTTDVDSSEDGGADGDVEHSNL